MDMVLMLAIIAFMLGAIVFLWNDITKDKRFDVEHWIDELLKKTEEEYIATYKDETMRIVFRGMLTISTQKPRSKTSVDIMDRRAYLCWLLDTIDSKDSTIASELCMVYDMMMNHYSNNILMQDKRPIYIKSSKLVKLMQTYGARYGYQ